MAPIEVKKICCSEYMSLATLAASRVMSTILLSSQLAAMVSDVLGLSYYGELVLMIP
jgi:hypothetical protein